MTTEEVLDEVTLARLKWRCRRGMLELDLLLGPFAERGYRHLTEAEREIFHQLLDLPDQQLLEYLLEQKRPEDGRWSDVITKIRDSV